MCWTHWSQVPKKLKKAVWNAYSPGQEVRKDPSQDWIDAADAAIKSVPQVKRS